MLWWVFAVHWMFVGYVHRLWKSSRCGLVFFCGSVYNEQVTSMLSAPLVYLCCTLSVKYVQFHSSIFQMENSFKPSWWLSIIADICQSRACALQIVWFNFFCWVWKFVSLFLLYPSSKTSLGPGHTHAQAHCSCCEPEDLCFDQLLVCSNCSFSSQNHCPLPFCITLNTIFLFSSAFVHL